MALDQEAIDNQLALLAVHRRTLAHLLQQAAQFGGEVFALPQTVNGLVVARANITLVKTALRENGHAVEDEPNDDAPSTIPPDAIEAARNIAEQRAQDAVLATYISQIEGLVADKGLLKSQSGDEVRVIARARTLTALRQLDGARNRTLIEFLRDVGLLVGPPPPLPDLFSQHPPAFVLELLGQPPPNKDLIERPPPVIEPSSIIDLRRANLGARALPTTFDLLRVDLSGVDLSGIDFQGTNLGGANLQRANLRRANLEGADLGWADLQGADLLGTNLQGANLEWAKLQNAILWRANLRETELGGAYLTNAQLGMTNLREARLLAAANLQGAYLNWIDLQKAFLQGIDLQGAKLRGANLQAAILDGANLQEADLRGANLHGATLEGRDPDADLKGQDKTALLKANLTGANLQGATMPDGSKHE